MAYFRQEACAKIDEQIVDIRQIFRFLRQSAAAAAGGDDWDLPVLPDLFQRCNVVKMFMGQQNQLRPAAKG